MRRFDSRGPVGFILTLLLVGFGCAGRPAPAPTCTSLSVVELVVEATPRINEDDEGRPLPTIVRVHQLSEGSSLAHASYEEALGAPEALFGGDLLGSTEVTVFPGERRRVPFALEDSARHVAAIGVFRQPASWSSLFEVPADAPGCAPPETPRAARLVVAVEGSSLRVRGELLDGSSTSTDETPPVPDADLVAAVPESSERRRELSRDDVPSAPEVPSADAPSAPPL